MDLRICRTLSVCNITLLNAGPPASKWETMEIRSMDGSQQIGIYNIAGQTKVTVSIASLNNGFYIAVLKRKNGAPSTVRFIKI